jgi:hypothetical protein
MATDEIHRTLGSLGGNEILSAALGITRRNVKLTKT